MRYFLTLVLLISIQIVGAVNETNLGSFDDLVYWSEETKKHVLGSTSKLNIDEYCSVTNYNLGKGFIVIECERTVPLVIFDVFSGKWVKTRADQGVNVFNFTNVSDYAGLRVVSIGSPWGFAVLKERVDPFYFEDYALMILKSEIAKFSWERAGYSVILFSFGFALAYYIRRELLVVNTIRLLLFGLIPAFIILLFLGMNYTTVAVESGNSTKLVSSLYFEKEKVKDMWNWLFALFMLFGYVVGCYIVAPEKLILVKPLFDRIEIKRLPWNSRRGVLRDEDNELCRLEIEHEGEFKLLEDGKEFEGFIELERRVNSRGLASKVVNKGLTAVILLGILALGIFGNVFDVFRIDLICLLVIASAFALVANITVLRDFFTVNKDLTIVSTKLVDNPSYAKDLSNQKIVELAKKYNEVIDQLIRVEYGVKVDITRRLLNLVEEVGIQPLSEGGDVDGEEDKSEGDRGSA